MLEVKKVQKVLKKLEKKIAIAQPVLKKRLMKKYERMVDKEQILLKRKEI